MYGEEERDDQTVPYGLFTNSENSIIGKNEEDLTTRKLSREAGVARFREIVKGQIAVDRMMLLKLPFHVTHERFWACM